MITVVCGKSISQTKINCQQKYNESVNNAFLSKLSDVDAFYGDRVVLTILLKDARWQVEWFGFNDKFGWSLINPDNSRYNIVSVGNVRSVIVDDIGEEDLSKVACVVNKGADVSNCKVCLKRKEGDEKDYNVDSIGRLLANKLKMAENGS